MSAQVAADLRVAADALERDGWTQGAYATEDGCRCLVGAIAVALGGDYGEGSIPTENAARAREARKAFAESFGDMATDWWMDIIDWNDEPGRTAAEVIAALRAAADRAEAES